MLRHLRLGFVPVCDRKVPKRSPVFDPVTMSTLIALRRFHTASRSLPFEPAVTAILSMAIQLVLGGCLALDLRA
jgi:hypothetical protein